MDNPNRIVIEVINGVIEKVLAERPDETTVIVHDRMSAEICRWYGDDYEPTVFGNGGLPIEQLTVEHPAVGVAGGAMEVEG